MKWINLKLNKCPKCDKDFGYQAFSEPNIIICPAKECGFKISHKRYSEIVNSQVTQALEREWDQDQDIEAKDDYWLKD